MTKQQILKVLRDRYEKKYVSPLISKFPKPLVMFDEKQVRLKKQIDLMLDKIDRSEICSECKGRGVIFEENDHILKEDPSWNSPWIHPSVDQRAIKNDRCMTCFGDGILISEKVNDSYRGKVLPARSGSFVRLSDVDDLVCEICRNKLNWVWSDDLEDPIFEAVCHGRVYTLKCSLFSVSIKMEQGKELTKVEYR
jgi:hypothetical protein